MRTLLVLLALIGQGAFAEEPANFYLLEYRPGVNWNTQVPFMEQPGIKGHEEYLRQLYDNDVIRMAGQRADGNGVIVLVRVSSREQARAIAEFDPAVINQILEVDIVGWRVELSSMRHQKRTQQPVLDPEQSFTIERLDPDSQINLKKN